MQRWQGAALGVALCSGCLEPMVDDDPGYSRYVLPPGSAVESAYADLQINRKIDMQDGINPPAVMLKTGFAGGQEVKYWDFGAAKRSAAHAYALASCTPDGQPLPDAAVGRYPIIIETIPGDTDYSPYRAINWVCTTDKYKDEVISSSDALNDAIDLGLVRDPRPADIWVHVPVIGQGVEIAGAGQPRPALTAYYKGKSVLYTSFEDQEGRFPYEAKPLPAPNVYDIVIQGSTNVVRTVFAQPLMKDGAKNPAYSPQWSLYTVTLKPEMDEAKNAAELDAIRNESDLVTLNMMGVPMAKPMTRVTMVTANMTTSRVNRPLMKPEQPQ